MATEAPPKRGRPAKTSSEPKSDIRTVTMGKTAEEVDFPRLQHYKNMGYDVVDDGYQYIMTGSQKEFEGRDKGYKARAIAQAERTSAQDTEGDNSKERTISRTSRVQLTADEILGNGSSEASDLGDQGYLTP